MNDPGGNSHDYLIAELTKLAEQWDKAADEAFGRVPEDGPDDMSSVEDDTMGEVYANCAAHIRALVKPFANA